NRGRSRQPDGHGRHVSGLLCSVISATGVLARRGPGMSAGAATTRIAPKSEPESSLIEPRRDLAGSARRRYADPEREAHTMAVMPSDAELTERLDHADEAFLTQMCARTPGARVVRQDGLLLAIGAVPSPVIVNTITTSELGVSIDAIDRAEAVFEAEAKHPSILSRDHADASLEPQLAAAGWHLAIRLPGIVLDARLPLP